MRWLRWSIGILVVLIVFFAITTVSSLQPPPHNLKLDQSPVEKYQIVDRHDVPLTVTYKNRWNLHYYSPLEKIPEKLQTLFILSEDKNFYQHSGIDWWARLSAVVQNIRAGRAVRGASTITEQVIRLLHPRPRTLWSRWLEGFEALLLEQQVSKADILEFYLNQIPYAGQRRGIVQAAQHYFNRSLDTLSLHEMLSLVVLIRAPDRWDLYKRPQTIQAPLLRFAQRLQTLDIISQAEYQQLHHQKLALMPAELPVNAPHFAAQVYKAIDDLHVPPAQQRITTTLDASLQKKVQAIVDQRVQQLYTQNVNNAAALVVDHHTQEILAWVNAGSFENSQLDAITTPRQPGSTLKPFLYALALEKGWSAATLIADTPLAEAVGTGMHSYHNYSRTHYGLLRLRDALGNSLNIPAIRAIQFVGVEHFLQRLRALGLKSLMAAATFYGDGLALGNGEVSLLELVSAYSCLAQQGLCRPAKLMMDLTPVSVENGSTLSSKAVINPEVASLISHILADADARRLEFGGSSLLRFPLNTAVKTGTSNDYHDAWTLAYNHRYTVGVWLGNLDQKPMKQVSGATGAALIVRAIFAELNQQTEGKHLYLSPRLIQHTICRDTGEISQATDRCAQRPEWFLPQMMTVQQKKKIHKVASLRLRQPSYNLQLALDPRIPDEQEAYLLQLTEAPLSTGIIEWIVDEQVVASTPTTIRQQLWKLERGQHHAKARIILDSGTVLQTASVPFNVK